MKSKFMALEKPGKLREFILSYFVATLKYVIKAVDIVSPVLWGYRGGSPTTVQA